ncbi:MAG: LamG-like jellyroll fold domain-containing protein [Planctomycetota bacterium]
MISAEANLADACSIQVEFSFRKTGEIRDNEIKLYYWDGSAWDFIEDLNSLDPNDAWPRYSDDINVNDEYHLQTDFKIKFEANITSGGTVYIDDVRIRNTWPAAAKWYEGRRVEPNYPVSLEPLKKYYWRIDTIIDGDVVQGDWWTFSTGLGGLIMWCTFDGGVIDNDFPGTYQPDTDTGHTIEFTKYTEPDGWVRYGEANPMYNSAGTSVNFDPNAGLYRLDPCKPSEIDPLRLDGYQYTIEMWVKPTNLSEEEMDDQVIITKGGESEDDGEEWDPDTWGVVIKDPGTDDGDDNEFRFYHSGAGMSTDEDTAVNDEWTHIAAVYNQEHPDPDKQLCLYWNGILDDDGDRPSFNDADANSPVSIGFGLEDDANFAELNNFFYGMIDELRIYDIALSPHQFLLTPGPEWASYPRPFYGQVGVEPNDPNLALMWNPGTKAVSHKVYLSTDFEDVNSGHPSALIGTYDTNEANDVNAFLEVGKIYYWRVDEVNEQTWEGVIWRFTTEFPILDEHLILWYPFDEDSGRFATDHSGYGNHGELDLDIAIPNWEDANGHYGGCLAFDNDTTIDVPSDDEPSDVLDRVTDEITISVWLYGLRPDPGEDWDNDSGRVVRTGAGTRLLEVRVPAEVENDEIGRNVYWRAGDDVNDAVTWEVETSGFEGDWHHFAFVKDENADKMYIYLDGVQVSWKPGDTDSSLSYIKNREFEIGNDYIGKMDDLRIYDYAKPESQIEELYRGGDLASAWGPSPYDGQPDAPRDANLAWNTGDYADSHDVYFGTDYDAVRDANTAVTLGVFRGNATDESNDIEILELDTYYYWRVDEVNDSNGFKWKGNVWSFKVADYIIVDNFESYASDSELRMKWCAGMPCSWTNPSTVALGVYDAANPKYPSHSGDKMMRLHYDNYSGLPFWSEAYLPLAKVGVTNWTEADVKALTLFFYGAPPDPGTGCTDNDQMYVGINDTTGKYAEIRYGEYERIAVEDINDLNEPEWHRWFIGLSDFNDPCYAAVPNDINLADVNAIFIGFGDKRNPQLGCADDGQHNISFDDIRLSRSICRPEIIKPVGDFSGRRGRPDCVVDIWDIAYFGEREWLRDDANLVDVIQEPCDANLIGHWKLDVDPCDSSSYNHYGFIDANTTDHNYYSWVVGHDYDNNPSDRAVHFALGRGRILVEILVDDNNTLRPKYAVTVSAWVYFTEEQDDGRVVVKGAEGKETYKLEVDDWDRLDFQVTDVCDTHWDAEPEFDDDEKEAEKEYERERMLGSDILYPNAWAHVAGTFDGDTNTVRAYVNAVLVDEANDANSITIGKILSQDTNDLGIGARPETKKASSGDPFSGSIDEVRIYNYALDANEIAWLATDGTGYRRLRSQANLYDLELPGEKAVNFRDLAVLIDEHWLEEIKWP